MSGATRNLLLILLRISCFFLFLGRGWEHLYMDAPYRTIFWDQNLLEPYFQLFNLSWDAYIQNIHVDRIISIGVNIIGLFYLSLAVLSLFIKTTWKKSSVLLILGSLSLVTLSLLFYKAKGYKTGQFIEYSIQWLSPTFLYIFLFTRLKKTWFELLLKIAVATTFIGHGLFAIGYYPTPNYYSFMFNSCMQFLGFKLSPETISTVLWIAGFIDIFIIGIVIFLWKRLAVPVLVYASIWGLLTATARVVAYTYMDPSLHIFMQWMPQTLLRICHGLIPLVLALSLSPVWLNKWKGFRAENRFENKPQLSPEAF